MQVCKAVVLNVICQLNISHDSPRMKPEESALGNALLSLTLWLSDVYAAAVEIYRVAGELNAGRILVLLLPLCAVNLH